MERSQGNDDSRRWPETSERGPCRSRESAVKRIERLQKYVQSLQAEKERLEEENQLLKHDPNFGMLTRSAFMQLCRFMPRGIRVFAFLDLDGLKALNNELGYAEVNRRIRKSFACRRKSDVVARWFSGDEIVILFDGKLEGARNKIQEFQDEARRNGLEFTYELGTWVVASESVEAAVDRVAQRLLETKCERSRRAAEAQRKPTTDERAKLS